MPDDCHRRTGHFCPQQRREGASGRNRWKMGFAPPLEVLPNQVDIKVPAVNRRNQRDPMTGLLKSVDRIEQNQSPSVDRGPWCLGGNQKNSHAAGIVHRVRFVRTPSLARARARSRCRSRNVFVAAPGPGRCRGTPPLFTDAVFIPGSPLLFLHARPSATRKHATARCIFLKGNNSEIGRTSPLRKTTSAAYGISRDSFAKVFAERCHP